LSADLNALS